MCLPLFSKYKILKCMKKLTAPFLLVGTATDTPEIRYATGFVAPDSTVVIHHPDKTILIVSSMEYGRALRQAGKCTVESPETLRLSHKYHANIAKWALAGLIKYSNRTVSVSTTFPFGVARYLEKNGVTIILDDNSDLKQARAIKSENEIQFIAHAQKAARAAMAAAGEAITKAEPDRSGVLRLHGKTLTSEAVRTIIRRTVIEFGCIDEDTIVAGGKSASDPHDAGSGPLKSGEWIVCDIFPRSLETGYWGDMTRTFMNGQPTTEQKRLYTAVKTAQKSVLAIIAPGVTGDTVHAKAADILKQAGFKTGINADGIPHGFFHSTGHGVGLEIHESPRLAPKAGPLHENMVVTVEPGLYYPDIGGVRIEDLVVVRAEGAEIL